MAEQPEEHPVEGDELVDTVDADQPEDSTEQSLAELLASAQHQLREVIENATSQARDEVEAAAAAVAAREEELSALESSLLSERATMQAQWDSVSERAAAISERERELSAQIEETNLLRERAAQAIADALERSAQMIEEAESRIQEEQEASRARMEADLAAARSQADEIHEQAQKRLEAARAESAATLQRAAERSVGIVATAEASVERSKAQLRQLVEQIQRFLDWQGAAALDLDAQLDLDMRSDFETPPVEVPEPADAPGAAEETTAATTAGDEHERDEHASVAPALGAIDVSSNGPDEGAQSEGVAGSEAMEAYFTDEEQPADESRSGDERVAKAVRRAVQGWSSSRRGQSDD